MKDIFIVESPFQLLCANEAIIDYKSHDYMVIVRENSVSNNNKQLRSLCKLLPINQNKINYVYYPTKGSSIYDLRKVIVMWWRIFFFSFKVDRFFVGSLTSGFINALSKLIWWRKKIALDDGNKTIEYIDEKSDISQFYTAFSEGKINKDRVIINQFNWLRRSINTQNSSGVLNVLFIGGGLYENGVLDQNSYIEEVEKIVGLYAKEGREVHYYPHRVESESTLELIAQLNGVVIKKVDYPIELLGVYGSFNYELVVSFYSSALITMSTLYSVKAISHKFDYSSSSEYFKKEIDLVYQAYRDVVEVIG